MEILIRQSQPVRHSSSAGGTMGAHLVRCTAHRIARRGLPHPISCVLCNQEDEDIQHILIGCFASSVLTNQVWS
jgi:hypothetical protein